MFFTKISGGTSERRISGNFKTKKPLAVNKKLKNRLNSGKSKEISLLLFFLFFAFLIYYSFPSIASSSAMIYFSGYQLYQ